MGFEFADATAGDLAEVAAAGAAFRRHWESFQNMQPTPAFVGGVEDITALDFLDYEQLGTPDGGLRLAALAWGNVLAVQAGLPWVRAVSGDLWLGGGQGGQAVLWPYARLVEYKVRKWPHDDHYLWLTHRVVEELIESDTLCFELEERLRGLQAALGGS